MNGKAQYYYYVNETQHNANQILVDCVRMCVCVNWHADFKRYMDIWGV